jgi:hypothetical protein
MKRPSLSLLLLTCIAALVAGCSYVVEDEKGSSFNTINMPDQKVVAGVVSRGKDQGATSKPVEEFTDADFKALLGELSQPPCEPQEICPALNEASLVRDYGGFSGVATEPVVRVANNKNLFGTRTLTVKGQILEKCLHDPTLDGYHYSIGADGPPSKPSGDLRLCVLMRTAVSRARRLTPAVRYQYFHVEAKNARWEVKKPEDKEKGVFHEAFDATELKVSADMAKPFEYKLYAAKKDIKIVTYWEANWEFGKGRAKWETRIDRERVSSGNFERIPLIFAKNETACIDMMFSKEKGVPKTLDPGDAAGVHYCLGRCSEPPIVNTR